MKSRSSYFKVWAAALALVIVVGSCKDDDDLPAIDGYNSSDEVASSNLVAHWSFDDNNNEVKSSTAPANTYGTVSSTDGKIGKALLVDGGALVYPVISAINTVDALNNFSVSMWINIRNNKTTTHKGFTPLFGIVPESSDFWGNIYALAETQEYLPTSDTLKLKNYLSTTLPSGDQSGQDNIAFFNGDLAGSNENAQTGKWFLGAKDWVHYVMTWDATTHKFEIYANAVASGGYTNRGTTPVLKMQVPARAVFGTMAFTDVGFHGTRAADQPMGHYTIDDVRVFNAPLSAAEITALFNLGTAGR